MDLKTVSAVTRIARFAKSEENIKLLSVCLLLVVVAAVFVSVRSTTVGYARTAAARRFEVAYAAAALAGVDGYTTLPMNVIRCIERGDVPWNGISPVVDVRPASLVLASECALHEVLRDGPDHTVAAAVYFFILRGLVRVEVMHTTPSRPVRPTYLSKGILLTLGQRTGDSRHGDFA